jgi:plasmid stabilization system protein ParE
MKHTAVLRPAAQKDVAEGDAWYEEKRPGLGDRFLLEVQRSLDRILENPRGYQRIHKEFRQLPLSHFPYVIVYVVKGTTILVMRVFHTSQHPRKKFSRKK